MSKHLLYFFVINLLIIILLGWNTYIRYDNFREKHVSLSKESVRSLAKEVSIFINERQRLVTIFAEEHPALINKIIRHPDNDELKASMEKHLSAFFPEYFTFTIADKNGQPYLVDFDGHIGELCTQDISEFAHNQVNKPQVHPGADAYHFDIMTSIDPGNSKYIFFVSFHTDNLGKIVKSIEIPDHRLELVLQNGRPLLEVNRAGARNKTPRDNYRFTDLQINSIVASSPVKNSRWYAVDSLRPALLSSYLQKSTIEAGVFMLFSILITSFFYLQVKKEEERRIIAENSKNDFLSIVSHELRTPLTSIHGAINLLADRQIRSNPEKSEHMIDVAKRNCNQLLFLINEILDFRKIETGKLEYNFQHVALNNIIEEAIIDLDEYAKQYNVNIHFQHHDPVYIQADENRITQVVNNLLSNAIKYGAPNDTVSVDIESYKNNVRVNVRDHGTGIPDDFTDKIFGKFSQANISGKSSSSAGLGLNIARNIIEAHGGNISFTTSPEGTTFYFDLPLATE